MDWETHANQGPLAGSSARDTPQNGSHLTETQLITQAWGKIADKEAFLATVVSSSDPSPMEEEHTPNSVLQVGLIQQIRSALPEEEVALRVELQRRAEQQAELVTAANGFRPIGSCVSQAHANATPVQAPQRRGMFTYRRSSYARSRAVRLGTDNPTALESALESTLASLRGWLQSTSDRLRRHGSKRRRATAEATVVRDDHIEQLKPAPYPLQRSSTW
jgi:hypothetical protein